MVKTATWLPSGGVEAGNATGLAVLTQRAEAER